MRSQKFSEERIRIRAARLAVNERTQWLRLLDDCAYSIAVLHDCALSMTALTQQLCSPDDRTYPITAPTREKILAISHQ